MLEKSPDADLLREMIGFAPRRLMELEVESQTGAAYGEKTRATVTAIGPGRTRAGTVELRIPKLHKGSYIPGFLEPAVWPRRRSPPWCRKPMCRGLDSLGQRPAAGDGHERHLQEPGEPALAPRSTTR